MKKTILTTVVMLAATCMSGAVTLRYHNKDSKSHTFKVKIDGSVKEVTFDPSKTASVTIQGGAKEAVIISDCGEIKVQDGDKIQIEKGCIKED